MSDWSTGRYELTAADLQPGAEHVIRTAAPAAGEQLLDVGCGTGSAALLAARRGARVIGIDPAVRLLDVAAEQAAACRLDVDLVRGDAVALPFDDGSFDVAVSSFGVIFAPDARAAVGEMLRVLRPGGRIALSSWRDEGALGAALRLLGERAQRAGAAPRADAGVAWGDPGAVRALLGDLGASGVATHEGAIPFARPSAAAYLEETARHNPMGMQLHEALRAAGDWDAAAAEAERILVAADEDPGDGFRVTSPYVITCGQRV